VSADSPRGFFDQKKKMYLLPGQIMVADAETLISTLLGSCVAVCLHDPLTKIGGMNHYLLPEVTNGEKPSPRYGVFAIPQLIEELDRKGADIYQLQAKIFGGGNVIANNKLGQEIGIRNIAIAEKMLKERGIWVVRKDVGGERGRRITFDTTTFEVLVHYNLSDDKKTA
jgi:two-component system chemotaxis response regulator CheB